MSCNFLVKFDGEQAYELLLINGCSGSSPGSAVIRHFVQNNPGLSPKSFDEKTFKGICKVWIVYQAGVCKFEECFEIYSGPVQIIKNTKEPAKGDNIIEGIGWRSRKVAEKPPVILPFFEPYCRAVSVLENETMLPEQSD